MGCVPISITNPEPADNPATRRQMYQLAAFAVILFSALIAAMIMSFVGIFPNWVGWTANLAIALVAWFLGCRSESLRRRLKASRSS
jgi:membrane protein YdbS with pleckstrin-like domain